MTSHVVHTAVVGAGIAGAAAAWALAPQVPVALLEQEPVAGRHATGRSAAVLSETSGTALTCALATASRPFLEAPPDGFSDAPLLAPRGLVWVGEPGDEPLLAATARQGAALRPSVRPLAAPEVLGMVPVLRPDRAAVGGVHEPDAMAVDVDALLQGYLRGVRRHGGRVLVGVGLVHGRRSAGGWELQLSDGSTIRAEVVVDAAGAWGDDVARRCAVAPLGLQPYRRTAALVAAPDSTRHLPLVMDVAGRWYLEPDSGGLLVSPADETPSLPCDAQADELDVALALERVAEATTLTPRHVRRAWAGLRTFTADRSPVVGADPGEPTFVWLVGQGGAGIKTAPAMAMACRCAVLGEEVPAPMRSLGLTATALSPERLTGTPV